MHTLLIHLINELRQYQYKIKYPETMINNRLQFMEVIKVNYFQVFDSKITMSIRTKVQ